MTMKKSGSNFIRWIATLTAFMLNIQIGLIYGWTPPNIAWYSSEKSPIPMTTAEISWLLTAGTLGCPVGSILGSISVEYLGSRKTVLVTYLLSAASWTCLLFATSAEWLYAARFISGVPPAMLYTGFSLFLSEVADSSVRGTLISLASSGMIFGMIIATITETYLPKNVCNSFYLTIALIGTVMICWLKDTPYILAKKHDLEGAKKSIKLYSANANVDEELEAVRLFVDKSEGVREKLEKLRAPSVKKSMFTVSFLFGLPYLSGAAVLIAYMEVILTKAKVDIINPADCVIGTFVVMMIASFSTVRLTDKVGRKILLIVSITGTSTSLFTLGLHFYLMQIDFDVGSLQWLPIVSIIAYFIFHAVGYGCVPGTLLSEMFPENVKSLAGCSASLSAAFGSFVAAKAYQPMVDAFGDTWALWIFAGLATLGMPCVLFLLIETKGKTFQQIQNELFKR